MGVEAQEWIRPADNLFSAAAVARFGDGWRRDMAACAAGHAITHRHAAPGPVAFIRSCREKRRMPGGYHGGARARCVPVAAHPRRNAVRKLTKTARRGLQPVFDTDPAIRPRTG
ncbi:hypothetical protein KCP75_04335 [Salmonella enterica subsp. enterica]|nr:hypothetical protein KCP75_04335 [Salmonella enterica subsp. enterica]